MTKTPPALALSLALSLCAGCSAPQQTTAPPQSTFQSPGNSLSPQPPNSLPEGFTTEHPLTPGTGRILTVPTP